MNKTAVQQMENPWCEEHLAHHIYNTFCQRNHVDLKAAIAAGMIPKNQLIKDHIYLGHCRNADHAVWDGKRFEHIRYKFGHPMQDHVPHPQDDDGFDVFVPVRVIL